MGDRTSMPIYLDNHATTRVDPRVLDAMLPYFTEHYGNAASINHPFGWKAQTAVDVARTQVARCMNADPRGVVFTSGATEAINLAMKGLLVPIVRSGRPAHVITSVAEHRAGLETLKRLERAGLKVSWLPVDEFGRVSVDQVETALRPETKLVSLMAANNEVGTLNPVAQIGALCRQHEILFHCDAVQAVGRIPFDFEACQCDLVSVSAHKMYGPKGVGALVVRKGSAAARLEPQLDGGGQESHLRSGTLAVPLLVGFGVACDLAREELDGEMSRLRMLRNSLWQRLQAACPDLILNGHPSDRLPGNLNYSVPNVDGEVLMNSIKELALSSGSACTSTDPEPSHVLRAMGRSESLARASLRIGLGRFTTESDVDFAAKYLLDVLSNFATQR